MLVQVGETGEKGSKSTGLRKIETSELIGCENDPTSVLLHSLLHLLLSALQGQLVCGCWRLGIR